METLFLGMSLIAISILLLMVVIKSNSLKSKTIGVETLEAIFKEIQEVVLVKNGYIQELNDALFGKKDSQKTLDIERFIINENELPILVPKSPMARNKKVTLEQLMSALNKAINTENRRIKRIDC